MEARERKYKSVIVKDKLTGKETERLEPQLDTRIWYDLNRQDMIDNFEEKTRVVYIYDETCPFRIKSCEKYGNGRMIELDDRMIDVYKIKEITDLKLSS